jgi:hypothetical protein
MNVDISEKETQRLINALGGSYDSINQYYPNITEPLAKPSELELTPREFFYWCDKGVIDMPKSEEGQSPWSRLNLLDVIWIRIVKELRRFNFPFPSIVKIKEDLFQNIFLKLTKLSDTELLAIFKNSKDKALNKILTSIIDLAKKDPEELKKQLGPIVTPMGALLADILLLNRKIHIHICKVENDFFTVFEGYSMQHTSQETLDAIRDQTHITLSLNELIAEYLLDIKYEKINIEFGLITNKEIEILEAIRNKEITEITINKGENESLTYTCTKRSELKDEQVQMIKRLLRMNEFNDVRVVLRNDKHIYLENKTRKKL